MNNQYWATEPQETIGQELFKRIDTYYRYVETSGFFRKCKKSYRTYYGYSANGNASDITSAGAEGELSAVVINDVRNLLQHILVMTTMQRASFECHATNTDSASQSQAILGKALLDYYLGERNLERSLKDATELSLIFSEGFVKVTWDATTGEVYGVNPDTGSPIYQGDISYSVHSPLDVVRDINKDNANADWYIVREFVNKYDLAAKYPDLAEQIIAVSTDTHSESLSLSWRGGRDTDLIAVYEFYHKRSPALPNGRCVHFVTADCILLDSPLPYRKLPVFRIAGSDQFGSPFGYSVAFDLLGIAEVSNVLYSAVVTNQSSFAVQSILVAKGSNIDIQEVSSGLNLVEYDSKLAKPEAMQLTHTAPEVFNFLNTLDRKMETLSGVGQIARGNAPENLKSGTALALMQSQSINFNSGLQNSYSNLLQDTGLATLNCLMDFASVPRVAMIAGKTSKSMMKQFTGKDLENVQRVTVAMGSALQRTSAGKVELAENLLKSGFITHADQYLEVISTGCLTPLTEGDDAELHLIRQEAEALGDGQPCTAIITDEHALHINEHKTVLSSLEARQDPAVLQVTLDHLQQHINFLKNSDPQMIMMLKQKPLQPDQPPQQSGPQGPPQAPPQGPPTQNQQAGMQQTSQVLSTVNPINQKAMKVQPARMPVSPLKPQN